MANEGGTLVEENIAIVERYLGKPFPLDFSEAVRKIRTQLVIAGIIGYCAFDLSLVPKTDNPIFGMTFSNLSSEVLLHGLLLTITYLWVHFTWTSWNYFLEWKLRLTGTPRMPMKLPEYIQSAFDLIFDEAKPDQRQSTLYNWWQTHAATTGKLLMEPADHGKFLLGLEGALQMQAGSVAHPDPYKRDLNGRLIAELEMTRSQVKLACDRFDRFTALLDSPRIPASLRRFDRALHYYRTSENLRWIVLEWATPYWAASM